MKKIYIVLTQTGTLLSRIVKLYTRKPFNHTSISMDRNLDTMYSFGRLNPYNPFWGGFVVEGKNIGTFKRFKYTSCRVYQKLVTDEQYEKIVENIKFIDEHKDKYKFNIWGLFLASLRKYEPRYNKFYCSEFIKYILIKSEIDTSKLSNVPYPMCFEDLDGIELIYEGLLCLYGKKYIFRRAKLNV